MVLLLSSCSKPNYAELICDNLPSGINPFYRQSSLTLHPKWNAESVVHILHWKPKFTPHMNVQCFTHDDFRPVLSLVIFRYHLNKESFEKCMIGTAYQLSDILQVFHGAAAVSTMRPKPLWSLESQVKYICNLQPSLTKLFTNNVSFAGSVSSANSLCEPCYHVSPVRTVVWLYFIGISPSFCKLIWQVLQIESPKSISQAWVDNTYMWAPSSLMGFWDVHYHSNDECI